jgi:hypothetical protein
MKRSKEKEFFKEIQKYIDIPIIKQFSVCIKNGKSTRRILDGYIALFGIAIEFYESHHKGTKGNDEIRMREIESSLPGIQFFIVWEHDWFSNKRIDIIHKLQELCNQEKIKIDLHGIKTEREKLFPNKPISFRQSIKHHPIVFIGRNSDGVVLIKMEDGQIIRLTKYGQKLHIINGKPEFISDSYEHGKELEKKFLSEKFGWIEGKPYTISCHWHIRPEIPEQYSDMVLIYGLAV